MSYLMTVWYLQPCVEVRLKNSLNYENIFSLLYNCPIIKICNRHQILLWVAPEPFIWKPLLPVVNIEEVPVSSRVYGTCVSTGQCRDKRFITGNKLQTREAWKWSAWNAEQGLPLPAFFIRQQKGEDDLFWSHLTLTKQCITDKMLIYCCKENNGCSC